MRLCDITIISYKCYNKRLMFLLQVSSAGKVNKYNSSNTVDWKETEIPIIFSNILNLETNIVPTICNFVQQYFCRSHL